MPAKNNINPDQLKMFMTPREIDPTGSVDSHRSIDTRFDENSRRGFLDRLMKWKRDESEQSLPGALSLSESIKRFGVINPVQVVHSDVLGRVIGHGNHRFASVDPDTLIPVVHTQGQMVRKFGNVSSLHVGSALSDYEDFMEQTKSPEGAGSWDEIDWR